MKRKLVFFLICVLILSAIPTSIARAQDEYWWDYHWLKLRRLTFNNSASSENLVNFPVLVNLTASNMDWASIQSDGDDLRFIDSDNSTELDYEIEHWDYAREEASIWVEIPQIDSGSTTDHIFMYYNNSAASSAEDVEGTWNQDYVMVQHLQEENGSLYDSTANSNDGSASPTTFGQDKWVSGLRGNALEFDRVNDYVDCENDVSLQEREVFSIELWFKLNILDVNHALISKGRGLSSPGDYGWTISTYGGNNQIYFDTYNETSRGSVWSDPLTETDEWIFLVITKNGTVGKLYLDGVLNKTDEVIANITNMSYDFLMGSDDNPNIDMNGTIDDVRYYNRVINSTEISYSYNSGSGADPMNTTGLVGWWKLDESGLTENATDSSGEGNHGTLYGYPPDYTSSGQIDGATDFDGNEDHIGFTSGSELDFTDNFTISAMFKSDFTKPLTFMFSQIGRDGWWLRGENDGDIVFWCRHENSSSSVLTASAITQSDTWYQIVGVFSASSNIQKIYVNGTEKASMAPTINSIDVDNYLRLGWNSWWNYYSCGIVDECRISNVSRTADWIEAQYLSMTDQFITYSAAMDMFLSLFITVENAYSDPVEDACVSMFYLGDLNFTEFTDEDGEIPRKIVDEGNYTLIVSADNYQTYNYILFVNQTTYWVPQLNPIVTGGVNILMIVVAFFSVIAIALRRKR